MTMIRQRAMNPKPRENEQRTLSSSSMTRMDGEGNERKFILSFSSEQPYERWWGIEILDHDTAAVDLSRLNDIGCLLFNHNRDAVIGKVNRAWIENNRGYAEVEFDTDALNHPAVLPVFHNGIEVDRLAFLVHHFHIQQPPLFLICRSACFQVSKWALS